MTKFDYSPSLVALVPATADYAQRWHEWRSQAKAQRFMPMQPASADQLAERLAQCGSDLGTTDYKEYRWFVTLRGLPIGTVALSNISTRQSHGEISYHLDEAHHGHGAGKRAVGMLVDKIFAETSLNRLFATISVGNTASIGLAEALGFTREACLRQHFRIGDGYVDQLIYGLLRQEVENSERSAVEATGSVRYLPGGARLHLTPVAIGQTEQLNAQTLAPRQFMEANVATIGPTLAILRTIFGDASRYFEFGPVGGGAVYELRMPKPPRSISVSDGYFVVDLGGKLGHFHIAIWPSQKDLNIGQSHRACQRAALFQGYDASGRPANLAGFRCWNGAGVQILNISTSHLRGIEIIDDLIHTYGEEATLSEFTSLAT